MSSKRLLFKKPDGECPAGGVQGRADKTGDAKPGQEGTGVSGQTENFVNVGFDLSRGIFCKQWEPTRRECSAERIPPEGSQ